MARDHDGGGRKAKEYIKCVLEHLQRFMQKYAGETGTTLKEVDGVLEIVHSKQADSASANPIFEKLNSASLHLTLSYKRVLCAEAKSVAAQEELRRLFPEVKEAMARIELRLLNYYPPERRVRISHKSPLSFKLISGKNSTSSRDMMLLLQKIGLSEKDAKDVVKQSGLLDLLSKVRELESTISQFHRCERDAMKTASRIEREFALFDKEQRNSVSGVNIPTSEEEKIEAAKSEGNRESWNIQFNLDEGNLK